MQRPFIKMCGFTRPKDVRSAVEAGADLIGLVHHTASKRNVSSTLARSLATAARATPRPKWAESSVPYWGTLKSTSTDVRIVAVMVDPTRAEVRAALDYADIVQFHGSESPAFCRRFDRPFMKAHRLGAPADADQIDAYLPAPANSVETPSLAWAFLVDAFSANAQGGTGEQLSPALLDAAMTRARGFVAGGLTPDNVRGVIERWQPFGVDVSSGIERSPGRKSGALMDAFVQAVVSTT